MKVSELHPEDKVRWHGTLAAHVLVFVGKDSSGQFWFDSKELGRVRLTRSDLRNCEKILS